MNVGNVKVRRMIKHFLYNVGSPVNAWANISLIGSLGGLLLLATEGSVEQITITMNKPLLSLSLKDFWRRWSVNVSYFLKSLVYLPCLKLGMSKAAAGFATFAGSIVFHAVQMVSGSSEEIFSKPL